MRPDLRQSLVIAAVLVCSMPSAASASGSPTKLLASILAAARAERSVHYASAASSGAVNVSFVGDAGVSQGIQRITYRKGTLTGQVTVVVSGTTAYARGDAFSLVNYMGFSPTAATKYAGVWILIPHTARGYAAVSSGVTLSSAIDELKVAGQLTRLPNTTIDAQRVLGVRGKKSSSGHTTLDTLYAQAAGPPLPVKEIASQGAMRFTATFGMWNEAVHVVIPTATVPMSVVDKTP